MQPIFVLMPGNPDPNPAALVQGIFFGPRCFSYGTKASALQGTVYSFKQEVCILEGTYLSREGYQKLKQELEYLAGPRRRELTQSIERAREFGDLRENAEYNAAKEAQALNEIKIGELSRKLAGSKIIDDLDIPSDKVYIGATVALKDLKTGEELSYTLVSESEADFLQNKISVSSPIGKGLLGRSVDETAEIQVPAGMLHYQILDIQRH